MGLLVVGSVAYDSIQTPTEKVEDSLGGAATYISLAASYFTKPVHMVAVVGEDFKDDHFNMLKDHGIDLEGLQVIEGGKTFRYGCVYREDMNVRDTLFTELNVFEKFNPVIPENQKDSEIVLLGNIDPVLQNNVLEQMPEKKFVIMDTMNLWIDIMREKLINVISKVNVIIINDSEARMLTEEKNLVKCAEKLKNLGPEYIVIKKGEHGALLFGEGQIFSAPAYPLETLFDPTGAGDVFAGGFTGYLQKSGDLSFENMKKAVFYGSAMASFCCEKFSTLGIENLSDKEIDDRYQAFIQLSQVK